MARPRRNPHTNSSESRKPNVKGNAGGGSSSSNESTEKTPAKFNILRYWKAIAGWTILAIAIAIGYEGYLETRVNTPFDDKKMVVRTGLEVPERFWGTYRPGVYFGLKTRDPRSIVTGLMWYFPMRLRPGGDGIRHWCEQNDGLETYGWLQHDGANFGVQKIQDGPFEIHTSFVKRLGGSNGGDWTARIEVNSKVKYCLFENRFEKYI